MKIEILGDARVDLLEGYRFYEIQSAGLGRYFLESIFSDIDSLLPLAGIHRIVNGSHRCLSKKFPFAVYYRIEGEVIRVRAVLDCRRDPAWIQSRLKR